MLNPFHRLIAGFLGNECRSGRVSRLAEERTFDIKLIDFPTNSVDMIVVDSVAAAGRPLVPCWWAGSDLR